MREEETMSTLATTKLARTLLAGSIMWAYPLARADVVAEWNAVALSAVESSAPSSANALRSIADVHITMFEAMNFIEGRYVPRFVVKPPMPIAASSEAAAAAAAYEVLVHLYPEQSAALDVALDRSVGQIPDGDKKWSERTTGTAIGANIYAIRIADRPPDRSQAGQARSVAEPLVWNAIAAKLVEARRLTAIESARIHALVAIAVSDVYSATSKNSYARRVDQPCAPCAAAVATLVIFESEFGSVGGPAETMMRPLTPATTRGWIRPADYAGVPSLAKLDDSAILRAFVNLSERWARDSEREIGRKSGTHALTHYVSAK